MAFTFLGEFLTILDTVFKQGKICIFDASYGSVYKTFWPYFIIPFWKFWSKIRPKVCKKEISLLYKLA
jgi:hypothetical protein